jgi:hypothetical protein
MSGATWAIFIMTFTPRRLRTRATQQKFRFPRKKAGFDSAFHQGDQKVVLRLSGGEGRGETTGAVWISA